MKGGGKEGQGPKRKAQDSATTANKQQQPDIEAWAVIEEILEDKECQSSFACKLQIEGELYDLGALCHMSPFCHNFISFCPIQPHPVMAVDKQLFFANRIGDLQI